MTSRQFDVICNNAGHKFSAETAILNIYLKRHFSFADFLAWDLASANNPECLGVLYGIVGKIELQAVVDSRLMLIKECAPVGDLPGGKTVYKIKSVTFLQLGPAGDTADIGLKPCKKHQNSKNAGPSGGGIFDIHQKAAFVKTWGTIKSATNTIKNTTQQAAALATSQVNILNKRNSINPRCSALCIYILMHYLCVQMSFVYVNLKYFYQPNCKEFVGGS